VLPNSGLPFSVAFLNTMFQRYGLIRPDFVILLINAHAILSRDLYVWGIINRTQRF